MKTINKTLALGIRYPKRTGLIKRGLPQLKKFQTSRDMQFTDRQMDRLTGPGALEATDATYRGFQPEDFMPQDGYQYDFVPGQGWVRRTNNNVPPPPPPPPPPLPPIVSNYGSTFSGFASGDVVENQQEIVTKGLWTGNVANLQTFYTASSQTALQKQ